MKIVDRRPLLVAASATPWAWLPADAATTSVPAGNREILLVAPRILNEPVRWRCSGLKATGRPASFENMSERSRWVGRMTPATRSRASSMSASVIMPTGTVDSLGWHAADRGARVRTYSPKPADIQRAWHVIDADGLVLGRLSTEVARLLRGKHKPMFAPHLDTGDHVIVVN